MGKTGLKLEGLKLKPSGWKEGRDRVIGEGKEDTWSCCMASAQRSLVFAHPSKDQTQWLSR